MWPVKTRCFRCGCPKGHTPLQPDPCVAGPLGRLHQRSAPTNPSYRPQRQNSKPVHPTGTTQNFPPLNQPLPVGLVDSAASVSVKSSFKPAPAKEKVPLAVQLANKTKERGTIMGRIEHYRHLCRDLETKLTKQSELLDEAVERKATLQNEINELEARIAEEESRVPPVPPPGPPPAVPVAFSPPPEDENVRMRRGKMKLLSMGLVLASLSRRKRASLRLAESRSSVFAKLSKLSSHELLKLSEQCSGKFVILIWVRTSLRCLPRRRMMHKVRS